MSFLKKLFGNREPEAPPSEEYKGFRITPTPIPEGPTFRVSARIEKEVDGETRTHTLIRADTIQDLEDAQKASVSKAQQVIDTQGERLFD